MSITLSDGGTSVELNKDLLWTDEFSWSRLAAQETRSLTGARIVQVGVKQGGRPITLQPEHDLSGWTTRAVLAQLYAWAQQPNVELSLTLRGITRAVEFRLTETVIEARPVEHYDDTDPEDNYLVTLRFLEI